MNTKKIILKIIALLKKSGIDAAFTVIYDNQGKHLAIVLPEVNPEEVLDEKHAV